jgi:hypothetical protein
VPDRTYSAEEVDAAVARLAEPGRMKHAEEVVTHAAPSLQRVLNQALDEGGFFAEAHEGELARAAGDPERLRALVAEETRLGMLIGVAVGFALAHELQRDEES